MYFNDQMALRGTNTINGPSSKLEGLEVIIQALRGKVARWMNRGRSGGSNSGYFRRCGAQTSCLSTTTSSPNFQVSSE